MNYNAITYQLLNQSEVTTMFINMNVSDFILDMKNKGFHVRVLWSEQTTEDNYNKAVNNGLVLDMTDKTM
jgi:hypothetical protein